MEKFKRIFCATTLTVTLLALAALCLSLLICLGGSVAWAANPVYVDDDFNSGTPGWGVDHFATIQNGVNAVDAGGTVNVAAGPYVEDNILISQGMTVQGAGVGSSIIDASASVATGSVVKINLTSGNVLFDGFTIKTGTSLNGIAPYSSSSGSTITISHNKIDGFGPTATGDNFGLIAGYGSVASLVFTYNEITNCCSNTILLERHVGPTDVSHNTFDRNHKDIDSDAFFCMNYGGTAITTLQKVSHNTIDMGAGTVFTSATRGTGITFCSSFTGVAGGFTNVQITDNAITNLKPYRRGIGFWNNAASGTSSGSAGDINAPVVARNTITGASGYTGQYGIRFLGLVTNGSVTNNSVDGVLYGFAGVPYNTNLPVGSVVNGNSFTNITNYLDWQGSGTLDASANWWGSNVPASVVAKLSGTVDYTPWLHKADDTSGDPGFQGDYSILDVDDDSPQVGAVDRIREAVALSSGSTINLMAGTYTNSAQVVIGKDIAMVGAGAGSTTINKSFDTGNSGDARGWFLVQAGYDFDLSAVTLDGAGKLVHQAIRNKGEGSADDVVFTNIKYNPSGPDYAGIAIAAFGTGPVNVSDCVFSAIGRVGVLYYGSGVAGSSFIGSTYTGKGPGNWLDYALDISAGAVVTVDNSTVSACRGVAASDGSTSAGIMATTYYGAGTAATITHCELTDNTTGIEVGYDASDASTVVAHYNAIYGNGTGVHSTAPTVNALTNWWGDATGPYHATLNAGGLGNKVSDHVLFDPWMGSTNEVSVVPDSATTNCTTPITYTFYMTQAGPPEEIRGYDLKFAVDTTIVKVISPAADILEGTYLESVASAAFYAIGYGGGVYGVSSAILGGSVGATGNGDLFTVKLYPQAAGLSNIAITSLKVRDLDNNPLPASFVGGEVRVDCTLPTMEAIVEAQNACYKGAPTFANFGFDDDFNLDRAEYQIDALGWNVIFSGINAAFWDNDGWTLPGFAGLFEGSHTVYFRVKDDAGNWNGEGSPQPNLYSWSFVKDTVAPPPPTSFVALPGHNKVHLTWTNPTGDASWVGIEIRRVAWGDYPQYGTPGLPAPSYPADHTGGTYVTQTALAAYDDNPRTPRDIYYYAAFSYDCAGNYSAATVDSKDRSTSYWLGDISPAGPPSGDGLMDLADLALFSFMFAKAQGSPSWNAEADFGPTDDHGRFGIPLPDDFVDFEDLMILAMNYGKVSPLGTSGGLIALSDAVPMGELVSFRLVPVSREDGKATYAVVMENSAKVLKGFSLKVAYGSGNALESVTASRDLGGKASEHFFGVIERESGVVEICVAALGVNSPFEYTGEVARITVREGSEGAVQLKTVDLRDLNNNKDEVALPGQGGETPFVPVTTALLQNHPNPFNPTTTIAFDVAVAGDVRIEIYDVSGTLVRTLVNGSQGVGRHVATWDGRDGTGNQVHTGVYFYRMTAPGYTSQAKKMLLLK